MNAPLEVILTSEGDKVIKVKVKFANEMVIWPNNSSDNEDNSSNAQEYSNDTNPMSVDLEKN